MQRWQVGDVEVVRIPDLDFGVPAEGDVPAWAIPDFAPSDREVGISFSAIAIRAGERRIVVDPWLVNDGPRAAPDAGDHIDRLLTALADAGFPAESVDVVVNTHVDGFGWNTRPAPPGDTGSGWVPTFPNARYLYPVEEVDLWRSGTGSSAHAGLADLEAAAALDAVPPDDLPVTVAPGVQLERAPGHRDGHLAVRIASGGALAVIPGHLVLSPLQVGDPSRAADEDPAVAELTRRSLLEELADHDGLLITSFLGGPGGGVVSRDGDGFRLDAPRS